MLNKVMLIGNLGRDPEVCRTGSGQAVANFSVATSRKWKDRDGNRQEQTEWHNLVAWGRQAEIAEQYLSKGSRLYVEGRLQTRSWEDRNSGETKYRTEVVVDHFQMLGGGRDNGGKGQRRDDNAHRYGGGNAGGYANNEAGNYGPEPEDDDIPF